MEIMNKQEYKKPEITELSVGSATLNPAFKGTAGDESRNLMSQAGIGPG